MRFPAVLAAALLFAIGFIPLFGGPGYESALAAGLVLPSIAAIATALDVRRRRAVPRDAFVRGVLLGALLAGVGWGTTIAHGLRVGFCDASEGTKLFFLGPGCGAILGGVWGAIAGLVAERLGKADRNARILAVVLAVLGPVASVAVSLYRFYSSPMVFAFDPFAGFFAGTLYDSVITGLGRLATYRLGTLATLIAGGAVAELWDRDDEGIAFRSRSKPLAIATLAAIGSIAHTSHGPELGHYQTTATVRAALGHFEMGARCEIVHGAGTSEDEMRALLRDCDGHVADLERFFGARGPKRITVFLFSGPGEKGYLMGAANTYIAKPWRHEIYLQRAGFPHPVMRHELAHVVAGAFGRGPFRVSGPLFGLVPDPGRIEGVAVAAAPHDEELSLDEWARAMRDLKLLPPLERVFKLSFLGEPSSRAYVVAGAFVDFLRRTRSMEAVRRWYGGASLESAAGATLSTLETEWNKELDGLAVGDDVLAVARARFDQPAIFGRRCPHVVDRLADEASAALGASDFSHSEALYESLLALDPHDLGARFGMAACTEREDEGRKAADARALYERIATDQTVGRAARSRATETLGDRALETGALDEARRRYAETASVVVDTDRLRTLDVKDYATRAGAPERAALLAHFGDSRLGRDGNAAAEQLGAWAARDPQAGIPEYLLGRIYVNSGRYDLATPHLDAALEREIPLPSVVREALRLRAVVACVLRDEKRLEDVYAQWKKMEKIRAPERAEMESFVERCGQALAERPSPEGSASASERGDRADARGGAAERPPVNACPDTMASIPGAELWIGSPRGQNVEDEWPRYRTRLAAFCMDRTEVTVKAYRECVSGGACTGADHARVTCTADGDGELPINCVDSKQAAAFCASRGARLPTEAEWEYAATGGDDRLYSWGNEDPDERTCWKKNGACKVGSYPAGAFGLFDMTGNVWEWTSDFYGDYPWPPPESQSVAYRGGSWSRRFEKWMRARLRNRGAPDMRGSHLGFRCALTLKSAECPFGRDAAGLCLHGVLDADCKEGRKWNGVRCVPAEEAGQGGCAEGRSVVPGHGCVRDVPVDEPDAPEEDLSAVQRKRTPDFDKDCATFQATRPNAYRLEGGSHEARNHVGKAAGCKNRDVGVGWNSVCCP